MLLRSVDLMSTDGERRARRPVSGVVAFIHSTVSIGRRWGRRAAVQRSSRR